ncbi:flavodoxin family protein [Marinicauda algicola]|uniref:Flavodoxin family protein n=1 Tax=Marinicauda algicola TaxID=2029849 RepID=A0A4S2H274_9PROT|nr:NAD(P)H-dependent oxidoreductase [Marinicauda algicola]TGY89687.1 flavodoxin family protein [Marinicauda algicola]
MTTITLINGHPDPDPGHFCAALCEAYRAAAEKAGHTVHRADIGALEFGFLLNQREFEAPPPADIERLQARIGDSDHLVLVYPLWLGTMPARLKAFLEHLGRANFFLDTGGDSSGWPAQKMKGRSARVVVTMGMPGLAYRLLFGGHSLKALEKGILGIAGFRPVRDTIFGLVGSGPERRARMLETMARLGAKAR